MTETAMRPAASNHSVCPTPFHAAAASRSMTNAWTKRGRFTVAATYTDSEEEYLAMRNGVAVCDHSSIFKYRISGYESAAFLDRLVTRRIDALEVNSSLFSPFCNDQGYVIDFAEIFRLAAADYVLHTTLPCLTWLQDTAYGFADLVIEDITSDVAVLGVHGTPSSFAMLLAGASGIEQLKPREVCRYRIKDIDVHIARTRAFGELGYNIWLEPSDATVVWDRLFRAAQKLSIKPVGTETQDVCRLEAGHLVPNIDFIGARCAQYANRPRSPFELGLASCVDLTKGHFVGQKALQRKDMRTQVVGLFVEGTRTVTHGRVMSGGRLVGSVSSSAWSPRLGRVIALATVAGDHGGGNTPLSVEVSDSVELEPIIYRQDGLVFDRRFYASAARDATMRPKARP